MQFACLCLICWVRLDADRNIPADGGAHSQERAVRDMQGGADHPEGNNIYDFWTSQPEQAGLNVFPYEISSRSELRSQTVSEKI